VAKLVKVKSAIKSNYFNEFANVKALNEAPGKDPEQLALNNLSMQSGWAVFVKAKNRLMEELDEEVITLMESGANYEVIGQKTVIKEILKDVIRRLFNKVTDARGGIETGGTTEV